jgi:hypothetical protein
VIKIQQVAKKCLNVRFLWLESVLWAGTENTIIIKTYTVCATGVATIFASGIIVLVMNS